MRLSAFIRRLFAWRQPQSWMLLAALAWLPALPQTAPPAAAIGPYSIAGIVVNALTGDPVRRATVAVLAAEDSHTIESVETGSDGRFVLERLAAGKYQLTASKRGFLTAFYDQHEEFSTAIVTGPGQDTAGLTFRLVPGAVLYGVVTGDGGDRVEGAKVMLFQRPPSPASSGKGERITQVDSATTDDTGAYEFDGLAAGEYRLAVAAEPWFALHHSTPGARKQPAPNAAGEQNTALDVAYPVTFFDSTTDEAAATRILLADGSRQGANVNLHAVPALRLVVETPRRQGGSIAPADLRQTIFGNLIAQEVPISLDPPRFGTAEFTGIAPGRYELVQGDPPRIAGLDLTERQQVDPALGVQAFSVSGLLQAASTTGGPPSTSLPDYLKVTLEPLDGKPRIAPRQGTTFRGAFTFPIVPPGSWELWVESDGLPLPVLSVSVGSQIQAGNRVTVKDRPLSLVVTLNQGGTRIQGFVRKGGKGVAGAMVVLVPKDPAQLRWMARRDQSDSDGSFSLRDVAPGQYTVVAIEEGWGLDWARAGALSRFHGQGIGVTVTGKSGKLIQLSAAVPAQAR